MKLSVPLLLVPVILLTASAAEDSRPIVFSPPAHARALTGNLQVDLFGQERLIDSLQERTDSSVVAYSHKSPWLAAGLSALVPGAGEFYAGSYWKAAAFLAIDVTAWILAAHFNTKGDSQTDFFQNYADQHWSAVDYAQFSLATYVATGDQSKYAGLISSNTSLPPWRRVNWEILNRMERDIAATPAGTYYSHNLPPYGDQQYYELIGKYQQFYQGWDDADKSLTTYDQINAYLASNPTRVTYYAKERGKANDYYTTATTYVAIAIVNHILSAVDAALTASSYNHNIHASMEMKSMQSGPGFTLVPTAKVAVSF